MSLWMSLDNSNISIMADAVNEMADAADDSTNDVRQDTPPNVDLLTDQSDLPTVAEDGASGAAGDAAEGAKPEQVEAAAEDAPKEADDDDDDDGSLDVVVTGVEVDQSQGGASVVGAALLLGVQPHVVELVVTRARGSYCIRRDLTAFLNAIAAATAASPEINAKCPDFPSKNARNDAALAQWCGDVTQFLADHGSHLRDAPEWIKLVADSSVASAQSQTHMTAIEFILQPFPYEKIYIPRGSRHEVVLQVKKEDQFLVWRFEVEDHDIDLTVHFLPNPSRRGLRRQDVETDPSSGEVILQAIHATTRYVAAPGQRPVEGMYECAGPGTATLVWDNSYSRLRGKYIQYQAQVIHRSIMDSAVAAADAYDEAIQAKIQREEIIRSSKKNQSNSQLVISPRAGGREYALKPNDSLSSSSSYLFDTSAHLYRQLFADKLPTQSWLVSTPINVAGKLASRLFGTPQIDDQPPEAARQPPSSEQQDGEEDQLRSHTDGREAKSLLEELNGLNMQLLERLESCEDKIAHLTVERDQERSRAHLIQVEKENLVANLASKDLDLLAVKNDLSRIERERGAWREIQQERDALLEEKHRWAMTDDDVADDSTESCRSDLDSETKNKLEQELGQAEANVLRLRAELGYSLSNHLTGTSTRLEKIAREMTASKRQYEDQMRESEQEVSQLKQQLVKYRSQKRILVTEIKNIQAQSESQVAVAMAEANEARMVNKRLKKQNELLLTQIRSLVDEAREQEKKLQEQVEDKIKEAQLALHRLHTEEHSRSDQEDDANGETMAQSELSTVSPERKVEVDTPGAPVTEEPDAASTVPYTLSDDDIALLNGRRTPTPPRPVVRPSQPGWSTSEEYEAHSSSTILANVPENPYRARLVAFFQAKDPSMLPEVESMLESYAGVESMLFESLELKYNFMELNGLGM